MIDLDNEARVYRLHLELDLQGADMSVLQKWGKVKQSLSRDILVSPEMTLHALHYAIQKCFGWQNSHLHHFEFPKKLVRKLLGNNFKEYCKYCGLYFRFPYGSDEESMADIYWDDDYDESEDPKTWLKSKYTPPFEYYGTYEHYVVAQNWVRNFFEENQTIRAPLSFAEMMKGNREFKQINTESAELDAMQRYFEGGMGELLERLTLWESIRPLGDYVHIDGRKLSPAASLKAAAAIANEREAAFNTDYLDFMRLASLVGALHGASEKLEKARLRKNANPRTVSKAMEEYVALEAEYREKAEDIFTRITPIMPPLANELHYEYDYGDGWSVKITLAEDYRAAFEEDTFVGFYDISGKPVEDEELSETLFSVMTKMSSVCVEADGLPVMDDVGGIGGYCDFLSAIHGAGSGLYEFDAGSREWAASQGWTGRMLKPKNIL